MGIIIAWRTHDTAINKVTTVTCIDGSCREFCGVSPTCSATIIDRYATVDLCVPLHEERISRLVSVKKSQKIAESLY